MFGFGLSWPVLESIESTNYSVETGKQLETKVIGAVATSQQQFASRWVEGRCRREARSCEQTRAPIACRRRT